MTGTDARAFFEAITGSTLPEDAKFSATKKVNVKKIKKPCTCNARTKKACTCN